MDNNTEVTLKTAEILFKMLNDYSQIDVALSSARLAAGASLLIAVITLIGNYVVNVHSKKLDYRDDYYKKIIDKRIEAYEKVSQFLTIVSVKTSVKVTEGDKIVSNIEYYYCCRNIEELEDLLRKSIEVAKYSAWMSKGLDYELKMINNILVECMREMNEFANSNNPICESDNENICSPDREKRYVVIACKYGVVLDAHINSAEILIKEDWLYLHKVDEFLKSKF